MPLISSFYGMYIKMYFQRKEHNPPHFHVIYGEYTGEIEIKSLKMLEGDLPPKALTGACQRVGCIAPNCADAYLGNTGIY